MAGAGSAVLVGVLEVAQRAVDLDPVAGPQAEQPLQQVGAGIAGPVAVVDGEREKPGRPVGPLLAADADPAAGLAARRGAALGSAHHLNAGRQLAEFQ